MIFVGNQLTSDDNAHFKHLLDKTILVLENEKSTSNLNWNTFEKDAFNAIQKVKDNNVGEKFSTWDVHLYSGGKFPDIVIDLQSKRKFGIEVKTTQGKYWKTLGGSIMESTRIPGIDRISILFAKANPFKVRHCNFEDCITDVAVTHSPRYIIDFDIKPSDSIFKKINVRYDDVWKSDNPYKYFKKYFEQKAKSERSGLWFIDNPENRNVDDIPKLQIQFFNDLPENRKRLLKARAMVLFPEVMSSMADYKEISVWLLNMGILNTSLRDMFSAGKNQVVDGCNVPSKFRRLYELKDDIKFVFNSNEYQQELFETYNSYNLDDIKSKWKRTIYSNAISKEHLSSLKSNLENL